MGADRAEADRRTAGSLSGLYLRAAQALEQSASLAEYHAERLRSKQQMDSATIELERAERARTAAQRGRALASSLRATPR